MPRTIIQTACRSPLVWALVICIAAAVPLRHLISTKQSRLKSSQNSSVQEKPSPLALAARVENGRLRVTWDATSPMLVSALSAVLSVNPEHGTPDTQVLDPNQLRTGSAIFQPPLGHAKVRLVLFTEENSELALRSDPATNLQPLAPMAALSKPDGMTTSKGNMLLPKGQFKIHNSRTSVASPATPRGMIYRKEDVDPMTVGFREEIWQLSNDRVAPRPLHLIQPNRYYSLFPFTLNSVLISVRVKINTSGAVTSAESLSSGNALLNHLSSIAARAARESIFVPARFGNQNVSSTAILSYPFLRRK